VRSISLENAFQPRVYPSMMPPQPQPPIPTGGLANPNAIDAPPAMGMAVGTILVAPASPAILNLPIVRQSGVHCNPKGEPVLYCNSPGYTLQLNGRMRPEEFQSIVAEINSALSQEGPKIAACYLSCPILIIPIFGCIYSIVLQEISKERESKCIHTTLPNLFRSITQKYQGRVNLYINTTQALVSHNNGNGHSNIHQVNQYAVVMEVL
jgi:hypothetical protein